MTQGVVTFNYADWAATYPELGAYIAQPIAQGYFNRATLFLNNTPSSPVCDLTIRAVLLNMLTAHIAKLNAYLNGQAPSGLVGRISSATEGSVSVSTENSYPPGTAQWYQQTSYGSEYWAATVPYRSAVYVPGGQYDSDPFDNYFVAYGGQR